MTVIADGIDLGASDAERYRHLRRIIENVLADTDPSMSEARRRWILWLFLYICWWEGTRATTRTQTGGGPGRGLMQFEPATVADLLRNYLLDRPALIANLAAAAGVTPEEMREALRAFDAAVGTGNVWPNPANPGRAKKVEEWLKSLDSFGVKLMRYHFKRDSQHRFPPQDPANEGSNPQDDGFKGEFSEQWARWWKRLFRGSQEETPEQERERKKREFEARARDLDRVAAGPPPTPPTPPTPAPPTPTPTPPTPPNPGPTPPTPPPSGPCPFMSVLGPDSSEVLVLRKMREVLRRSVPGRALVQVYYLARPAITWGISGSAPARDVWRTCARQAAWTSAVLLAWSGEEISPAQ